MKVIPRKRKIEGLTTYKNHVLLMLDYKFPRSLTFSDREYLSSNPFLRFVGNKVGTLREFNGGGPFEDPPAIGCVLNMANNVQTACAQE